MAGCRTGDCDWSESTSDYASTGNKQTVSLGPFEPLEEEWYSRSSRVH